MTAVTLGRTTHAVPSASTRAASDPWRIAALSLLSVRFIQGFIYWGGGSRRFIYAPSKLDPHAALSYDASQVMITATEYLRENAANLPITAGNVWREITDIHTSRTDQVGNNKFLEGVTGAIDYGGDITRHVPLAKTVALLQVSNGEVLPNLVGFCGDANGHQQSVWCPASG